MTPPAPRPCPVCRRRLDQNFPTPLVDAVRAYLPASIEVCSLYRIDLRLSDLDDRQLFIALHQLGWNELITNNYRMLAVPTEVAAIVKTNAVMIAIEGLGHDPLRAVGALLLELPGLVDRIRPRKSNVFRLAYRRRAAEDAWEYFKQTAIRHGEDPGSLWRRVGVTDEELATPILFEDHV